MKEKKPCRTRGRQRWRGKEWSPERARAFPIYRLYERFRDANPHITFAELVDFAFANLFKEHPEARQLVQGELIRLMPDFSCVRSDDNSKQ